MKLSTFVGDMWAPATATELSDQVRHAADAGLERAWFAQAFGWDALTAAAVAGTVVPSIGLGTAVVPVPQRHPLMLASQALSVQAAVGNRFTLGIGAGVASMVEACFGLPRDRPLARMREYLTVLRPLLRGEQVEHRGELLTAAGSAHVPGTHEPAVLLAALGPGMLRLAGELADGALTWMTGPKTLATHIVPTVTRAARAAGRPEPRIVAALPVCVTSDEQRVRELVAERFGLAARVPEYRAVLDREGVAGPQDVAVVGDELAVGRHIERLADAGVTEFIAAPVGTPGEQRRTLDALAGAMAHGEHGGSTHRC